MKAPSAYFIRKVAEEVPELRAIPLFGKAPPFDWSRFSQLLSSQLQAPIEIKAEKEAFLLQEQLGAEKGHFVALHLYPLSSPLYWEMSFADLGVLTASLLSQSGEGKGFSSESLQEGFYSFLLLEALDALCQMDPFQTLTPELEEGTQWNKTNTFCIEIEIALEKRSCWGRLFLSDAFRKEWIGHFAHLPSTYVPTRVASQTPLRISLEAGSFALSQSDFKSLRRGDFISLDRAHAKGQERFLLLTLGKTPLFRARLQANQLELLDFSLHQEEPMPKKKAHEETAPEEELTPLKDLPLHVTVEVGSLNITLEQLMQLAPGNVLELPTHPEQGVFLTVGGQKVGRAELLQLGEVAGVRILEMG